MEETDQELPEMSPMAALLLDAVLRDRLSRPPIVSPPLDAARAVRYLAGSLSLPDREQVETALCASQPARTELRTTRSLLKALQARPWAEVEEIARGVDASALVARAWIRLLSERVEAAPQARRWWRQHDWEQVRRERTEGNLPAQAAWAAFLTFADRWKQELSRPRLALSRGGARSPRASESPGGAQVEAEVTAHGALRVTVRFPAVPLTEPPMEGSRRLQISLATHGALWPIASIPMERPVTECEIEKIGEILDLPVGSIPLAMLRIERIEQADEPPQERHVLTAEVVDRSGTRLPGSPALIELVGLPHWYSGAVVLDISLPEETRDAFPTYRLELEWIVSAHYAQHLGSWPVRDWEAEPRTLSVSCPGSPVVDLPDVSCLRARLRQ